MWALAVFIGGLLLTGLLAYRAVGELQTRQRNYLEYLANASVGRLHNRLLAEASELRALQSAFMVNDRIDQPQFEQICANVRTESEQSVHVATGFARRIDPGPGQPPRYVYAYAAPWAGNQALIGLDLVRQADNLRALERARDSDTITLSAPLPLLQPVAAGRDRTGVVMRISAYSAGAKPLTRAQRRQREVGAIGLSLRTEELMRSTLGAHIRSRFWIAADDVSDAPRRPLYSDLPRTESSAAAASHGTPLLRRIRFGRREWELRLYPRPLPLAYRSVATLLASGAAGSALLGLLLWSLATTRRRALMLGQRMSARFRESEERFRTLNELLPALVLLVDDGDGRIAYANQAARERLGDVVGAGARLATLLADPAVQQRVREPATLHDTLESVDAQLRTLAGEVFWARGALVRVRMDGHSQLLVVASDVSEQRKLTEQLSHQARHDALTELHNRREFEHRVERALAQRRRDGSGFAVLYIDLDQFKLINDISGHIAGDQLLVQLALSMRLQLRGEDVLARLGGDEFGVLVNDIDGEGARQLAERIRASTESLMFAWEDRTYTVSASIGVVAIEQGDPSLKDVLAWADAACYLAKDNGRNRVHVYREDNETIRRHSEMEWANRLRRAMDEDRLLLDCQEIVPLLPEPAKSGRHIELLLRLREEDGREILPGAFLPAAERYGLMPAIDRWVIRTALTHFDRLHDDGPELQLCAINLSGASVEDDGLADYILQLAADCGVAPQRLCFEITETVAVRNLLKVAQMVERLRSAGCQIALDDFGAGMSSFGYLKNLPADLIKIDGSFIRDLTSDGMSRTIVNAIAQIGHQRGLRVIAEWVGHADLLPLLRGLGVDYGQGFALHPPQRVRFQRANPAD